MASGLDDKLQVVANQITVGCADQVITTDSLDTLINKKVADKYKDSLETDHSVNFYEHQHMLSSFPHFLISDYACLSNSQQTSETLVNC